MERSEHTSSDDILSRFPHQWLNGMLVVDYPNQLGPEPTPERLKRIQEFSKEMSGMARKMNVTFMCNGKPFMEL